MSRRYLLDAYAWVEYLIGSDAGSKVKNILEKEEAEHYTCAVTLAEVVSKTAREDRNPETAYDILVSNSKIISVDQELSRQAGILHAEMRKRIKDFRLADAYVLTCAKMLRARILTKNPHFKGFHEAIMIV